MGDKGENKAAPKTNTCGVKAVAASAWFLGSLSSCQMEVRILGESSRDTPVLRGGFLMDLMDGHIKGHVSERSVTDRQSLALRKMRALRRQPALGDSGQRAPRRDGRPVRSASCPTAEERHFTRVERGA